MNDMSELAAPPEAILVAPVETPKKKIGRPPGAKNKPKTSAKPKTLAKPKEEPEAIEAKKVIENLQEALNKEVRNNDMDKLEIEHLKNTIDGLGNTNRSLSSVIIYLESKLREAWSED